MIVANNRAQSVRSLVVRIAMLAVVACGRNAAPPSPCPALTRQLAALPLDNPRVLLQRVDEIMASSAAGCADLVHAMSGTGIAGQLALARSADDRPAEAVRWLAAVGDPAIALRRAELYDRLGRPDDALGALAPALLLDGDARLEARLLAASAAARAGDRARMSQVVAETPLPDRPRVAHRAAADLPAALAAVADADDVDLATAIADRLEQLQGPAAARALRERAVALAPDDADCWDAVAHARMAAGATDDALAAWDKAAAIAPAQPAFRINPIRALSVADADRARTRLAALAAEARSRRDVELLLAASNAASIVGDHVLALDLASTARAQRPDDGRLSFAVAEKLAAASRLRDAATAYVELLACGAHGSPWHRHEVAARLQALPDAIAVRAALDAPRSCAVPDPKDLEAYVTSLRARAP